LRGPAIFAAAPHNHWLDAFAVASGMTPRLARRMLVVTNRDFNEYFAPPPRTPRRERFTVGAGYYLGLPCTFPFTIVPHFGGTREGLLETARFIDRGFSPLAFPKGIRWDNPDPLRHDLGMAVLALECGVPIVPVWLRGNDGLGWRPAWRPPRLHVIFGRPVRTGPRRDVSGIVEEVEDRWREMSSAGKV
jgi:1-acyl-sn-glycerol-3-phosphate acyltransferase